jgi:hypothetical protein
VNKPLIAIDGYNLALERGTGVATYSRSLSRQLRTLGAEVGVLYGQRSSSGADPLLREVTFFDPRSTETWWKRPISDLHSAWKMRRGIEAAEVPVSGKVEIAALGARQPLVHRLVDFIRDLRNIMPARQRT